MRIAIVYDWLYKFGGAERILLALHELYPDAPVFTSVYDRAHSKWAEPFDIRTTFLQKLPFAQQHHELYAQLTPFAFESFNFDEFDVVLTITSSDGKCIVTKPQVLHICYCLTPTRYVWSGYFDYLIQPGFSHLNFLIRYLMKFLIVPQRFSDFLFSKRPDTYGAISNTVRQRIQKYYKQSAHVIYPPVDTSLFINQKYNRKTGKYFLIVSRLVPYKKIDYIIEVCNQLQIPLKIIGTGIDHHRLKSNAKKTIDFITGHLTDKELCWYYQNCIALIFPGEEDFGLTIVEAQSCGKPVLGLNSGGASEIILHGKTGILYDAAEYQSFMDAFELFQKKKFNSKDCVQNAKKYSKEKFKLNMDRFICSELKRHKHV